MTVHYRAQFQTPDGRTHAVIDTQPITLARLSLAEALITGRARISKPVPPLIDLSTTPAEWLAAAAATA